MHYTTSSILAFEFSRHITIFRGAEVVHRQNCSDGLSRSIIPNEAAAAGCYRTVVLREDQFKRLEPLLAARAEKTEPPNIRWTRATRLRRQTSNAARI